LTLSGDIVGAKLTDWPDFNAEEIEKTEIIEHPPAATERSAARRVALQVLYEVDSTGHPFAEVIQARLLEVPISKRSQRYLRSLVKGVETNRARLDKVIRQYAPEWPLEQIAIIDRNILRLGIYELATKPSTSISVTITEAIDLADLFGADGSVGFIHGVLGAFAAVDPDAIRHLLSTQSENGD
jgi:transcription antitermination protein NusB